MNKMELKKIENYYINLNNIVYLKSNFIGQGEGFLLGIFMTNDILYFSFDTQEELNYFIKEHFSTL